MTVMARHNRNGYLMRQVRLERLEDRLALAGFGPEDGAYIVESRSGDYSSVLIQPADQKIVATGDNGSQTAVARYDALGVPDAAFGTGGLATAGLKQCVDSASSLQADGKVVVAGCVGGPPSDAAVARLNTDGSPDTSFSGDGVAEFHMSAGYPDTAGAVSRQSSGKIIVAGTPAGKAFVAQLATNGALDSGANGFGDGGSDRSGYIVQAFPGAVSNSYFAVAIQSDDKILAVGQIYTGLSIHLVVARYTVDGVLDSTFGGSGYSVFLPAGITQGEAVAVQADGKIVVAGKCGGVNDAIDTLVARYNADGTLDASFGGGNGYVRLDVDGAASETWEYGNGLAIQPDGKMVVAGYETATTEGAVIQALVARINSDGTPDTSFGSSGFKVGYAPNTNFYGKSVAIQANGDIVVAGQENASSGNYDPHPFLMRFFAGTFVNAIAENGAQSIPGFAQKLFPDFPPGGSPNTVFKVNNNNSALFAAQPAIDSIGTLTFKPAPNSQGTAKVTVIKTTTLASFSEAEADGDGSDTAEFDITVDQQAPWQNDNNPDDVDDNGKVVAGDVLLVIDYINGSGSGPIPDEGSGGPFYDVDGDNVVCAMDVLDVINLINASVDLEGEASVDARSGAAVGAGVGISDADVLNFLAYDLAVQARRRGV